MRQLAPRVLQLVVLILLALLVLAPLLWLVSTSLKGPAENIFSSPPALLPAAPSLDAYRRLFQDSPLTTYLLNSTVVSALAVVANLLFCSLAAYPLARMRFAGRGVVLALVVATILIPFQVVMIPLYLLMVQLGLRNTLLALIIPQAATAFGLYLLRQSFLGVPKELEEAARIDGCSRLGEWWNVMIPAARPISSPWRCSCSSAPGVISSGPWSFWMTPGFTPCPSVCSSCPARSRWIGGSWRQGPSSRFFRSWFCSCCCSVSSFPVPAEMR